MARQFNGTDQALQSAANVDLSSASVISFGFWLWWDAFANDDDLALEHSANFGSNPPAFMVDPNDSGNSQWGTFMSGFTGGYIARPSAAAWHHHLVVMDMPASTVVVYLDGTAPTFTYVYTDPAPLGAFASRVLNVMSRNGAALFGAGRMADLAIWLSGLTGGNAVSLAAGARANTVGTPAYYWRLDGTTSPEPATLGGVALNLVGAPTQVADPPALAGIPRLLQQYRRRRAA